MTHTYLLPIKTAALLFPVLAVVLLLPTAVVLYRRYGVMSHGRALSLFGFVYYVLTVICMTIVPLPNRSVDVCRQYAPMSRPALVPGHTFGDVWKEARHRVALDALTVHNAAVAGAVFNLVLLLPLGVFLRYHFRRGPWVTAAAGLSLSLALELTQGTGVWGIYPCPYRLLDIDDLLTNTAGAALGWALAGPVARRLPTLDALDGRALARTGLPFGRRAAALVVDVLGFAFFAGTALVVLWSVGGEDRLLPSAVGMFMVWFAVLPWLTGATPGKRLLLLRLVTRDGRAPELWRVTLRALVLGVAVLPLLWFLAVGAVTVLESRSLTASATLVRETGARRAVELLLAYPEQALLGSLVLGFSAVVVLGVLRGGLVRARTGAGGMHERISGVRNAALPPRYAYARPPRPTTPAATPARLTPTAAARP